MTSIPMRFATRAVLAYDPARSEWPNLRPATLSSAEQADPENDCPAVSGLPDAKGDAQWQKPHGNLLQFESEAVATAGGARLPRSRRWIGAAACGLESLHSRRARVNPSLPVSPARRFSGPFSQTTAAALFALTAFAVPVLALPGPASAASCWGIEMRVNGATAALASAVASTISTTQAALIAEEIRQRQLLLSAFHVTTAQSSLASDQITTGLKASAQAFAATAVSQDQNLRVARASHAYRSAGYQPCAAHARATGFNAALGTAQTGRGRIEKGLSAQPGRYGDPARWAEAVRTGKRFDAASLFDGDLEGARSFIDIVNGPPDVKNAALAGTAEGDAVALGKTNRDALRSASATSLAAIAADHAGAGPAGKASELAGHWSGGSWAAGMAGQHERGLLQDAIRMAASRLVFLAWQIKRDSREELSLAGQLLATVNAGIEPSVPPVIERGEGR